jgi:hypothetical protein
MKNRKKITGVPLRSQWITSAIFILSRSGARPPIREAVYKSPGSGSRIGDKYTPSVEYY